MITKLTCQDLIEFESKVAREFNDGKIRAPVHLYSGNEIIMLDIFKDIVPEDWVFCSWRSHYQCLLKGVPESDVFSEIKAGRSISLCFPEYQLFSSAMVGGILPIATGVAASIKRKSSKQFVHCFIGDMTAETGIAHECIKYSQNKNLPIRFIVEDNSKSVCTDTRSVWGLKDSSYAKPSYTNVVYYSYTNSYPHAGAGVRVQF